MAQARETRFYGPVESWLRDEKGCGSTAQKYCLSGLGLLEVDVVGFVGREPRYACEVKDYPFPVGSGGYGSVGQALAFRSEVPLVYVACGAAEDGENAWHRQLQRNRNVVALLHHIGHRTHTTFDGYIDACRAIFDHFFGRLGLGLLVVHEDAEGRMSVRKLREPVE